MGIDLMLRRWALNQFIPISVFGLAMTGAKRFARMINR
jgi:hypothetical protein